MRMAAAAIIVVVMMMGAGLMHIGSDMRRGRRRMHGDGTQRSRALQR